MQLWVSLNSVSVGIDFNKKENREQSIIPFLLLPSLSFSYQLHNSMSQELFGEALKHRNKKQEARRKKKIEQEKFVWKSLDIRDAGLEDVPPLLGRGEMLALPPLPPRMYHELVFCLFRCKSWVNNSIQNSEKRKQVTLR